MILKPFLAFILGGFICAIAQILIDKTKLTPARILVCFVVFGTFLGAIGLYEPIFEIFGCGISIPLIGFGGNIAKGVSEAVEKHGFLGALEGAFTASSAGVASTYDAMDEAMCCVRGGAPMSAACKKRVK
jgi:stage V sporulation protein AE